MAYATREIERKFIKMSGFFNAVWYDFKTSFVKKINYNVECIVKKIAFFI